MTITYDIVLDDDTGAPCDVLKSSIDSEAVAWSLLREARQRQPKAYLVRNMSVQMREDPSLSPKKGRK
jgi:hypothetical protein